MQLLVNHMREKWSSSIGFILASIGSAVGIGNIWRFPYLVGENGGGAFLIPYLIAVFLFGLPLMILEFALGRHFKTSVVPAFGTIGIIAAGFVLSVIAGWFIDKNAILKEIGGSRWMQSLFMLTIKIIIPIVLFFNLITRVINFK